MKVGFILLLAAYLAGCSSSSVPFAAAPKPTLTALQVYMNETSDYYESLAASTGLVKTRISAWQLNSALLNDPEWRNTLAGALRQIHRDYTTVSQAPPPVGTENYHQAMVRAEAHTDKAAELLLAWLSGGDASQFDQAMKELALSESGLDDAGKIYATLSKQK